MLMDGLLAQILIGWPSILCSLFISIYGIIKKRPYYLIFGVILIIGFAWYLMALPATIFKLLGFLLPLFHLFAIFFVRWGLRWIAGLFLLPQVIIALYFALVVLIPS